MIDIEARLRNWQAWGKDKPHYQRCKSLEGNYKAPPVWEAPKLKSEVDIKDALIIERCVIKLPEKNKMVLVVDVMYPHLLINERFAKTCTIIGISRKTEVFSDYLKQSKIMLRNLLTQR
jgi:hypothetical protein